MMYDGELNHFPKYTVGIYCQSSYPFGVNPSCKHKDSILYDGSLWEPGTGNELLGNNELKNDVHFCK